MAARMKLVNRTAVVTGAAGGIGRGISLSLARRGCHLALADVNETGLAETAQIAAATGMRTTPQKLIANSHSKSSSLTSSNVPPSATPPSSKIPSQLLGADGGQSRTAFG